MPKDEPMAPNPPNGAMIDYSLPPHVKAPVELEIADAKGLGIRAFASDKPVPAPDLTKIRSTADWIAAPTPLRTTEGQHRFIWDLHYQKPQGLESDDREENGVWAPPGKYRITLTANGKMFTQWLVVRPDPRVHAKITDYQHEFALARQIENARVHATAALKEAKRLHNQLQAQAGKAADKVRLLALDQALMRLADLTPEDPRNSMPPAALPQNALSGLADGLEKLAEAVDGADGAPTPDAESGFRQRAAVLAATLAEWSSLKAQITATLGKGAR